MSPGRVATWPENGAPTLPNPVCHSGNSSSHFSLLSVLPASQSAMSLTSSLAFNLWVPGSDPEKLTLVKSSDNQKISTVSRLGLATWCLPVYSLLARGWLWGWHFSSKPDVVVHPSQLSGHQGRRKLKAAGATQWDSVFKESPLRWLEARYSCSGLCSMGSQSLRSTAIKGRRDQLISALGRSVWLLMDCCVLLHGR